MPNIKLNKEIEFFNACQLGKSYKLLFTASSNKASKPLDLIHFDIWGPAPLLSKHGFKYYIIFLDDFSRYTWIFPLKAKSEALLTKLKNNLRDQLKFCKLILGVNTKFFKTLLNKMT